MVNIDPENGLPTDHHCGCNSEKEECRCLDPDSYHVNDYIHIEMDPDGVTHIWPRSPQDGREYYHPEWKAR
jgi:hypothetical protein